MKGSSPGRQPRRETVSDSAGPALVVSDRAEPAGVGLAQRVASATLRGLKSPLVLALLLAAMTLAAYSPVIRCQFIALDDPDYITKNAHVLGGLTLEGVCWALGASYASNWHPLTWCSHMLDVSLFGQHSAGHHITSLCFHLANTLLLFLLLSRTTRVLTASAVVAGLFALHPLHVESVAWVSERKDVLSAFFFLLTLLAYAEYAAVVKGPRAAKRSPDRQLQSLTSRKPNSESGTRNREPEAPSRLTYRWWYVTALGFFVLGLMSKPMLVTLPFVLLLLDYWPLNRVGGDNRASAVPNFKRLLLEKSPFFLLSAASSVVTFVVQKTAGSVASFEQAPLWNRLENVPVSYARYLGKMVWPTDLALPYPNPGRWPLIFLVGACLLVVALTWTAVSLRRNAPFLFVGWFWFVGMLVPVIGLVQVGMQSLGDRYTYLPFIGIALAGVWGVMTPGAGRFLSPRLAALFASTLLVLCAALTFRQSTFWTDSWTLFSHSLACTRNNAIAQNNVGVILLARQRAPEALQLFQQAVQTYPGYPEALNNLGLALALENRFPEAVSAFRAALRFDPDQPNAALHLGDALCELHEYAEAIPYYQQALRREPNDPKVRTGLGLTLSALGRYGEATEQFQALLGKYPESIEVRFNLARSLGMQGRYLEAIQEFEEILRRSPGLVAAGESLAILHVEAGDAFAAERHGREAILHWQESLRLKPNQPRTLRRLAWTLATAQDDALRDGRRAVELAERLVSLNPTNAVEGLDTLAAAYAEAGRFDEAVRTAQLALQQAQTSPDSGLAREIGAHLAAFRGRRPWRE